MRSYFTGGIGWVFCAIFALIMNFYYIVQCVQSYKSNFIMIFGDMIIFLLLLIPLMTMRIWSEEKKQKIDQLLLTAPIGTMQIVLGKFFAALCVFLIALSLTLVYPLFAYIYGTPEPAITIGNYIAVILVAGAYIAISQFMSSLTESQIISAILSIATLLLFLLFDVIFRIVPVEFVAEIASFISIISRFTSFTQGIFALSDAVYFISLAGLFLFFTSRVIEKRRWS